MSKHTHASPWTATVILLLVGAITALLAWTLAQRPVGHEAPEEPAPALHPTARRRPPDVVIFLVDTLRADRLGTYGYSKPTSPEIDALASTSVVFERAYAPAPWTLPSVVSLFTSTFPCEHGVLVDGQRVHADYVTLAQRLKAHGYATASFIANPYAGSASGLDAGFDRAELVPFVDAPLVEGWLDTLGDVPFFLYVHNVEPHDSYLAPQRLIRLFGDVPPETCDAVGKQLLDYRKLTRVDFANGRTPGATDNTAEQVAAMEGIAAYASQIDVLYDAAVRDADEKVGRVIEVLKRRERWDNTLFFLIADHGEELGDHGGWQHDQSVYDELVHVPLIVHLPAERLVHTRVPDVVSLVDVMPTVLDVVEPSDSGVCSGCSGASLRPYWAESAPHANDRLSVPGMRWNVKKYFRPYKEMRGDINVVATVGDWKGIFNAEPRTLELYDMAEDPGERRNLAADRPALVDTLTLAAREWLAACQARSVGRSAPVAHDFDAQQRDRLRSLGYVE